jgi:hypothetical protein
MYYNKIPYFLFCIVLCNSAIILSQTLPAVIVASVTDLRNDKNQIAAGVKAPAFSKDLNGQVAQLCFGECILVDVSEGVEPDDMWVKVSAIEQKIFSQQKWIGCPGYIQKKDVLFVDQFPRYTVALRQLWTPLYAEKNSSSLPEKWCSFGTLLEAYKTGDGWWFVELQGKCVGYIEDNSSIYPLTPVLNETESVLRSSIVRLGKAFLQTPYGWGCRTPGWTHANIQAPCVAGTDCSSLVNMLFRALGLEIPKNSTSQYIAAPIKIENGRDAKPGDLIFFACSDNPSKMCHVMIYMGKDQEDKGYVLESTGRGVSSMAEAYEKGLAASDLGVRIIALKDYIGVDIDDIYSGTSKYELRGYPVYIASYFKEPALMQYLRTMLLEY